MKHKGNELNYFDDWHNCTSPHLLESLHWLNPATEFPDKIQKDGDFLQILNRIRVNEASDEDLSYLNSRYDPHFASNESAYQIHLTTTNKLADTRNMRELQKLSSKNFVFE